MKCKKPTTGKAIGGAGAVLAAYSVYQLVKAYKDEDIDRKSRAKAMLNVANILVDVGMLAEVLKDLRAS